MFKKKKKRREGIPGKGDNKTRSGRLWCMHFIIGRVQNTKVKLECVRAGSRKALCAVFREFGLQTRKRP